MIRLFRAFRLRRLRARRADLIARYDALCRRHAAREHVRRELAAVTIACLRLEG